MKKEKKVEDLQIVPEDFIDVTRSLMMKTLTLKSQVSCFSL